MAAEVHHHATHISLPERPCAGEQGAERSSCSCPEDQPQFPNRGHPLSRECQPMTEHSRDEGVLLSRTGQTPRWSVSAPELPAGLAKTFIQLCRSLRPVLPSASFLHPPLSQAPHLHPNRNALHIPFCFVSLYFSQLFPQINILLTPLWYVLPRRSS